MTAVLSVALIVAAITGWRRVGEKGECPDCPHCRLERHRRTEARKAQAHDDIHRLVGRCDDDHCPRNSA